MENQSIYNATIEEIDQHLENLNEIFVTYVLDEEDDPGSEKRTSLANTYLDLLKYLMDLKRRSWQNLP